MKYFFTSFIVLLIFVPLCGQSLSLSPYFHLHEKVSSYLLKGENEKAITTLKKKCLKKYPYDFRSMYVLAFLYDENKEFDSAYTYLTKAFQTGVGLFRPNIYYYETDPLFIKYTDSFPELKILMAQHYQKADERRKKPDIDSVCLMLKQMGANDFFYLHPDNRQVWDSLGLTDSIICEKKHISDSINRSLLREIIQKYGWPTVDVFGFEAAENAFIIAQHNDDDVKFQLECLKHIEKEFPSYKVRPKDYAYLLDRIRVNLSKKQYFGTQFTKTDPLSESYSTYQIAPLINPEKVNLYRSFCNMPSLEEYKNVHKQRFEKSNK